jgi:hypothetical protein
MLEQRDEIMMRFHRITISCVNDDNRHARCNTASPSGEQCKAIERRRRRSRATDDPVSRGLCAQPYAALATNVDGRCSRKAVASVFSTSRDFASDSVERSTISDEGTEGSPNRWLISTVPGGASRQENTAVAKPEATASATAKEPQPRKTSVHGIPAASSARVAMFRMPQDGDDAANRSGSPAR